MVFSEASLSVVLPIYRLTISVLSYVQYNSFKYWNFLEHVYVYIKHDGTVPTRFNQSKASISFDYIA